MPPIDFHRVPEFYHGYIRQVKAANLADAFEEHQQTSRAFLEAIPPEKWSYRYAEDKWTISELVQHMIDAERIFCYRALRFARRDGTPLPGFEENDYAAASHAHKRSPGSLMEELQVVQRGSALLFASFDAEDLASTGTANGKHVYVEAIGYIIVGHALHHLQVLKERYLAG